MQHSQLGVDSSPELVSAAPLVVRVCGLLDTALLEQCIAEVVDRHEPLRVRPEPSPLRVQLLPRGADEHSLSVTVDPAVGDNHSARVFFDDLSEVYGARVRDSPSPLPSLDSQYRDLAARQRTPGGRAEVDDLAYWRRRLAGAPSVLDLPTDFPRPALPCSPAGAQVNATLPSGLAWRLGELSHSAGATLPDLMLAAYQLLSGRLGDSRDVLVGSRITKRSAESAGLIGRLDTMVALRTDLSGNPSFRELLARVRETTTEARSHGSVSFEQVAEVLRQDHALGDRPLFQVLFDTTPAPPPITRFGGLAAVELGPTRQQAPVPLALRLHEDKGEVGLRLLYQTALFTRTRVSGVLDQLLHLLAQIADGPDRPVDSYSLVSGNGMAVLPDPTAPLAERRYPSVREMIDAWVRRQPDRIAIEQDRVTWTYAELAAAADRIVGALLTHGLRRGDVVAVHGPHSPATVAAMVAAVSSGGVMLTLDRRLPRTRLDTVSAQAKASFLLFVSEDQSAEPPVRANGLQVLRVDGATAAVKGFNAAQADPVTIAPGDPACVFFTSGSTGEPKGVLFRHNSVSHFLTWQRDTFGIGPLDRWPLLARMSFDPVLRDVFLPLTSGATLCLAVPGDELVPAEAVRWLADAQITTMHLSPTMAGALLEHTDAKVSTSLRYTSFAAEPLTGSLVRRWRRAFPAAQIVNLYGLTENVLGKCWYLVPEDCPTGVQPVGWPLAGGQTLVLGAADRLCGVGEMGQIVMRGPYQSLGYLDTPAGLSPPYMPNRHTGEAEDLLWPTGDKGRYRPDGSVEILGRLDRQVKIRGVRVEPDEVAAQLAEHPAVSAAAVTSQRDHRGSATLVGYVTLREQATVTRRELRDHLMQRLPTVMVPMAFAFLDALPRTSTNKIDYLALPPVELVQVSDDPVAPRTATEQALCALWAETLGLADVGIEDNFFDLGGHSLHATQVVSGIRRILGAEPPLRTVFENPTVAGLATCVERALHSTPDSQDPSLIPVDRTGAQPLSFAQQRMWFLDRLAPGNPFYNVTTAFRLRGRLEVAALQRALDAVVARHEVLRTRIKTSAELPHQVVAEPLPVPLALVDLTDLSADRREGEAQRIAEASAGESFDLADAPLVRAGLIQFTPREYVLWVTMHHIVCDGWAEEIFFRELSVLYHAWVGGTAPDLPELPLQYADFAAWQHRAVTGERVQAQLAYWRERLDGAPEHLPLPVDRPRPEPTSHRGGAHTFRVDADTTKALRRLSRREGTTLYMTLLAGYQALLGRWSTLTDFLIATPVANRTCTELEALIGFFDNTLLMRADLSGNPSFRQLLARVRQDALGAYSHQDLPFEQLVEHRQPRREPGRNPLTQVLFALQNAPEARLGIGQAERFPLDTRNHIVGFDLMCSCTETAGEIAVLLEYSADLFDAATIESFGGAYSAVLRAVTADPQIQLSAIPLLDTDGQQRVLALGTGERLPFPEDALAHTLIEKQTAATPDAVAIEDGVGTLTYAELGSRANQLAHHLRSLRVGPECVVAVCLTASAHLATAVLGVWKAGGVFLPLDPQHPMARLRLLADDARAQVLVTQTDLLPTLGDPVYGRAVCCLDREWESIATHSEHGVLAAAAPGNLACVFSTSGSTGIPKGVMFTHRDLVSYTGAIAHEYGLRPGDRFLQLASIGFDVLIEEFLPVLATGGTVVFPRTRVLADGTDLTEYLDKHAITGVELTTAYWHEWVSELLRAERTPPSSLRLVVMGGERVLPERWTQWQRFDTPILHIYGLTEATITSTVFHPTQGDRDRRFVEVPIGRPIANTRVHVLDDRLEPLPVGFPGEVYIGGIGPARGYLGRAAATAERFLPDPHADAPAAVMYRTGDLARLRADGNLEFLGRVDHAVKIRGHRVEPGEVESVLAAHPAVREALVVVHEERPGDKQLVAYIGVPGAAKRTKLVGELRGLLRRNLPTYAAPSAIVLLDHLPMNTHGKVDRSALPRPRREQLDIEPRYTAPRTPIEIQLAGIVSELLDLDRVGSHDDFFALGGHSLLAVRLAALIHEATGTDVPVRDLVRSPTVAELAALVTSARSDG